MEKKGTFSMILKYMAGHLCPATFVEIKFYR